MEGVRVDVRRCREGLERSLMNVTVMTPEIGYQRAAGIAKRAEKENLTLREAAVKEGISEADFDRMMDYSKLMGDTTLHF